MALTEEQVTKIREGIATKHGYLMEMPTRWNFAMLLTHRRKEQIEMYEELLSEVSKEAESRAVERCIEVCKEQKSFGGFSDNETRIYDEGVENCITGLKALSQVSSEKGENGR